MSDFCPDGYVPGQEALAQAARRWFAKRLSEIAAEHEPATPDEPPSGVEKLARAFVPLFPDELAYEVAVIMTRTEHRLRNFLHQGNLTAYYFGVDGRQSVPRELWATPQTDGVLASDTYWLGQLFLLQSELDALLDGEPAAKKRPLPEEPIKPDDGHDESTGHDDGLAKPVEADRRQQDISDEQTPSPAQAPAPKTQPYKEQVDKIIRKEYRAIYKEAKKNCAKPPNIDELWERAGVRLKERGVHVTQARCYDIAKELEFVSKRLPPGHHWK
jgi:hypothetical protein